MSNTEEAVMVCPTLVYGYENDKCLEIVTSLILALEQGITLPPVQLIKVNESEYHIPFKYENEYSDGGHHRLIAHYLLKRPINCILVSGIPTSPVKKIHIPKINLKQNHMVWQSEAKLKPYLTFSFNDIARVSKLYDDAIDKFKFKYR